MKKYLILLLLILGGVFYVFYQEEVYRNRSLTSGQAKFRDIRNHIRDLELRRRSKVFKSGVMSGTAGALTGAGRLRIAHAAASGRSGPRNGYAGGYERGFSQGYYIGSYLSESRTPNPLFYPIPKVF